MPTQIIKTIGPTGDYATLADFCVGESRDLTATNTIVIGEMQAGDHNISSALDLKSYFTGLSETNYLLFRPVAGAEHAGYWDDTTGVRITYTDFWSYYILRGSIYTIFEDVKFYVNVWGTGNYQFSIFRGFPRLKRCLLKTQNLRPIQKYNFSDFSPPRDVVESCIFYGPWITPRFTSSSPSTSGKYIFKNTVFIGANFVKDRTAGPSATELINCAVVNSTFDANTPVKVTSHNNASDNGIVLGDAATAITDLSTVDGVDFVSPSTGDFHLTATSKLLTAGANLYDGSGNQLDLDKEAYPVTGAWPIGADYLVEASNDVTVSTSTDSLAITANNSNVTTVKDVSTSTDSLAITANNSNVTTVKDVSTSTGSLAITANNSNVTTVKDVSTSTDSLAITANNSNVTTVKDVTTSTDSLAITANNSNVTTVKDVSTSTDSLAITDATSSVTTVKDVTTSTDSLTITDVNANIGSTVNISTSTDSLAIIANNSSVTTVKDVSTSTDSLAITDINANIGSTVNINTNVDSLAITDINANIGSTVNINTNVDSLAITDATSSVTTVKDVSTNVANLTITDVNANIGSTVNISTSTDSLTITDAPSLLSSSINIATNVSTLTISNNISDIYVTYFIDTNYSQLNISDVGANISLAILKMVPDTYITEYTEIKELKAEEYTVKVEEYSLNTIER